MEKTSLFWQRKRVFEAGPWSNTNGERALPCWSHLALEPLIELTYAVWPCWPAVHNLRAITGIWDGSICLGPKSLQDVFPGKFLPNQLLKVKYQERKLHYFAHFESTNVFLLLLYNRMWCFKMLLFTANIPTPRNIQINHRANEYYARESQHRVKGNDRRIKTVESVAPPYSESLSGMLLQVGWPSPPRSS